METVLEKTIKMRDVRQNQDLVQGGAHGEHGQDVLQHVGLEVRKESVSVNPAYPGLVSSPPPAQVQVRTPSIVTRRSVAPCLELKVNPLLFISSKILMISLPRLPGD